MEPSNETEEEKLELRKVEALEDIARLLAVLVNSAVVADLG